MKRLTLRQRYQTEANSQSGKTCAKIGTIAGIAASMVSREIRTNGDPDAFGKCSAARRVEGDPQGLYCAVAAHTAAAGARERGQSPGRVDVGAGGVHGARLRLGWSPEQVAAAMPRYADGNAPCNHAWIYGYIRRDRKSGRDLHACLRRYGKRPRPPAMGAGRSRGGSRSATVRRSIARRATGKATRCAAASACAPRWSAWCATTRASRCSGWCCRRPLRRSARPPRDMLAGQPVHSLAVDNGKEFAGH